MIHLTHQTEILLATQAVDFRKGIDGFVALCRDVLQQDSKSGSYFVFINRNHSRIRLLCYDGTGYWLMTKRLSTGHFLDWPVGNQPVDKLLATRLRVLLSGQKANAVRHIAAQ